MDPGMHCKLDSVTSEHGDQWNTNVDITQTHHCSHGPPLPSPQSILGMQDCLHSLQLEIITFSSGAGEWGLLDDVKLHMDQGACQNPAWSLPQSSERRSSRYHFAQGFCNICLLLLLPQPKPTPAHSLELLSKQFY